MNTVQSLGLILMLIGVYGKDFEPEWAGFLFFVMGVFGLLVGLLVKV